MFVYVSYQVRSSVQQKEAIQKILFLKNILYESFYNYDFNSWTTSGKINVLQPLRNTTDMIDHSKIIFYV